MLAGCLTLRDALHAASRPAELGLTVCWLVGWLCDAIRGVSGALHAGVMWFALSRRLPGVCMRWQVGGWCVVFWMLACRQGGAEASWLPASRRVVVRCDAA